MSGLERPSSSANEKPGPAPAIRVQNVALSVLATLALFVLLRYAQELFIPLVLSMLIAFALSPLVTLLERFRINRTIASALVVIALITSTGYGAYALRNQVTTVLETVANAIGKLRSQFEAYRHSGAQSSNPIGKIQEAATEVQKAATDATDTTPAKGVTKVQIEQPLFRANDYLLSGSLGLLGLLSDGVLVTFLVFFMLASGDLFKRKLVELFGTRLSEKRLTVEILNDVGAQIQRFLLIQVLTCIAVGVCTALALWVFGLNQPVFWGVVAGVFSSVPYLGPIVVTVALGLVAFVQFDSLVIAAEILIIPFAIFSLEGMLVKPAVMGKAARINGVAMFVGLLFWSWIWGLVGLILAVPIMMVLKSSCDRFEHLRVISTLLDEH